MLDHPNNPGYTMRSAQKVGAEALSADCICPYQWRRERVTQQAMHQHMCSMHAPPPVLNGMFS